MKISPAMPLRESLRIAVPALLALIVLNIGLAHQNIWPTLWIRTTTELSLELIVFVTGIALVAALGARIGARAQWGLSLLVLLFVVARYVDVTAPALFGRRVDLYWDTQHIPAIAAMVTENWSLYSVALLFLAVVSMFTALLLLIRIALGLVCRAMGQPAFRKSAIGMGALLLAIYGAGMNSDALTWERRFAIPITPVYFEQARAIAARARGVPDEAPRAVTELRPYTELNGSDVFVIFLESYGRIALDDDAYSAETRATLAGIEAQLSAEGWQSPSAAPRGFRTLLYCQGMRSIHMIAMKRSCMVVTKRSSIDSAKPAIAVYCWRPGYAVPGPPGWRCASTGLPQPRTLPMRARALAGGISRINTASIGLLERKSTQRNARLSLRCFRPS
jgi:hypothetical protein